MSQTIKLGDRSDLVFRWRHVMAAMFLRYAETLGPLAPGNEFGPRAVAWQEEYERRTHQTVDGIVSEQDLIDLKLIRVHRPIWVFSLPGSGAPWWIGPSFDVGEWAKNVLNLNHQPIGTDIGGYLGLMGGDPKLSYNDIIAQEAAEFERQLDINADVQRGLLARQADPRALVDVEIWITAYSQSADGIKRATAALFGDGGKYALLRDRINGLLLFGDPARQPGPTKVGNSPPGSGISRWVAPPWLQALTWSITINNDFYAACDDEIRPLFYAWFIKAETELPFVIYTAQIVIPALLNLVAPFLPKGLGGLTSPLAIPMLAGASGVAPGLLSQLIGGITGTAEGPDPKLINFLSVQGILTNLPGLLKLVMALPGIAAHGDYYSPRAEFGNRGGVQVACDVIAAFRR